MLMSAYREICLVSTSRRPEVRDFVPDPPRGAVQLLVLHRARLVTAGRAWAVRPA